MQFETPMHALAYLASLQNPEQLTTLNYKVRTNILRRVLLSQKPIDLSISDNGWAWVLRADTYLKEDVSHRWTSSTLYLESSQLFWGRNRFLFQTLEQLTRITNMLSPRVCAYIRAVLFLPSVYSVIDAKNPRNAQICRDTELRHRLTRLPNLTHLGVGVNWDFEHTGSNLEETVLNMVHALPQLQKIHISRPVSQNINGALAKQVEEDKKFCDVINGLLGPPRILEDIMPLKPPPTIIVDRKFVIPK